MPSKVTIIGAGHVGATCAQRIIESNLADVTLVDIIEGIPQGKALDLNQSAPIIGFDRQVSGTNDFAQIKNSEIIVVAAGLPRKPGMTREDLLQKNAAIIKDIAEKIKKFAPDSIIIVITNPLDIMTQLMQKTTAFPPQKVMGMAGILDTARFSTFVAWELNVSPQDVEAMVLGGHGDAMVPLLSYTKVKGKPIAKTLSPEKIDQLVERTRKGGAEIVKHLKTGSAYYAPGSAAAMMVKAILKNEKKILPCSAYLRGQYGLNDVYIGVPIKLGKNGVEENVEFKLTKEELSALQKSAQVVQDNVAKLEI